MGELLSSARFSPWAKRSSGIFLRSTGRGSCAMSALRVQRRRLILIGHANRLGRMSHLSWFELCLSATRSRDHKRRSRIIARPQTFDAACSTKPRVDAFAAGGPKKTRQDYIALSLHPRMLRSNSTPTINRTRDPRVLPLRSIHSMADLTASSFRSSGVHRLHALLWRCHAAPQVNLEGAHEKNARQCNSGRRVACCTG